MKALGERGTCRPLVEFARRFYLFGSLSERDVIVQCYCAWVAHAVTAVCSVGRDGVNQ